MNATSIDDLIGHATNTYEQLKYELSSFLELDLDGFSFEEYNPGLKRESKGYVAGLVKKIANWDLKRRDNAQMHVDPLSRKVYVHINNFNPPDEIKQQGDFIEALYRRSELVYGVVHEMCHMFIYANDPKKRFPMTPEEDKQRFNDTLPLCEGVAHALTLAHLDNLRGDDVDGDIFCNFLHSFYLPMVRDDIVRRDYSRQFLEAEKAYANLGLLGVRQLLA